MVYRHYKSSLLTFISSFLKQAFQKQQKSKYILSICRVSSFSETAGEEAGEFYQNAYQSQIDLREKERRNKTGCLGHLQGYVEMNLAMGVCRKTQRVHI